MPKVIIAPDDQLNRGHRIHLRYPSLGMKGFADQCWQVDASGAPDFVDMTTQWNAGASGQVQFFPTVEGAGDYFAWGVVDTPFNHIIIPLDTVGTVGTTSWEYHNGTVWATATATGAGIGLTAHP